MSRRNKRRRAAAMLEFMLVFPMALVVVMFAFDVARVYMTMNATQYAASTAVRAGAVYGAAGTGGECSKNTSYDTVQPSEKVLGTFCQKVNQLPGSSMVQGAIQKIDIAPSGSYAKVPGECTSTNDTVSIDVDLKVPSLIPGLSLILGVSPSGASGSWNVHVHQEARCEVLVNS